uniref:Uncharacterized protein n=1 Tax=Anguilla anguilla TaxID=7936 RepID=A0A0E9UXN2_ANGAN
MQVTWPLVTLYTPALRGAMGRANEKDRLRTLQSDRWQRTVFT